MYGRITTAGSILAALALLTGSSSLHRPGQGAGGATCPAIAARGDRFSTPSIVQARRAIVPHAPRIRGRFGTSTNWGGYAVDGVNGSFSDVQGSWTVPQIDTAHSCPGSYSASWVGIDGDISNTVEQCGTEQDGNGSYYAWYEMYPKFPVTITYDVRPGDFIQAEVKFVGNNAFRLSLTDWRGSGQAWNFQTTQSLKRAQRSSVEWIMEAPWSGGVLPLANFGTISFSGCSWTGAGGQPQSITMVNNSGQTKADIVSPGWSSGTFSMKYYQCQ
jgi:hypothetical protein